jgi:8-oxo-dGTP diphosphatase
VNLPSAHGGPAGEGGLRVAAAVVWRDGRVLLTQRPPGGALGLQWEFPGGKIEAGESPEMAVVREVREELGVEAQVVGRMHVERHAYAHGLDVEITFIACVLAALEFVPGAGVHALRWVIPADIDVSQVLEADRAFVRTLGAK